MFGGLFGRRRIIADPVRVPPGKYVTPDFPVRSAASTRETALEVRIFTIDDGDVDELVAWT